MPAPPRQTADRHNRPREPGLLPAVGPVPREAEGCPGASGPMWSDTSVQSRGPSSQQDGQSWAGAQRTACPARPEGQHAGEASAAGRHSLTVCLGNRTRSRRTTSLVGARQLQSPSPARSTACPPPPHRGGPRAPGGKVTSPRRPERGRGQTQHSKDRRRCWRQSRFLEPKAWAR